MANAPALTNHTQNSNDIAGVVATLASRQSGRAKTAPLSGPKRAAIMMLALWAVVLMLGVSGYLMGTDRFFGEEWLQEIHEILANGLIVLIAAHILAAIGMSLYTRVNLPRAMITGRKNLPD